jgi:hypothetical protein
MLGDLSLKHGNIAWPQARLFYKDLGRVKIIRDAGNDRRIGRQGEAGRGGRLILKR